MNRFFTTAVRLGLVLGVLASAGPAQASFDVADLYLRKIRVGEKTFYADGGWQRWRTRNDFFYETDLIMGAGAGDPRLVRPGADEGPALTSWSFGDLVLLTEPRSSLQLTFFTLHSTNFRADEDAGALPFLFIMLPMLAADGSVLYQGLTGFQLRLGDWVEGAYGILMDMTNGSPEMNSFFEANLPIAFFQSSAVLAPSSGVVERLQFGFRYDEAKWMNYAEVGRLVQNHGGEKVFYYAGIDGLWNVLSADLRVSDKFEIAYARFGIHMAKVDYPGLDPELAEQMTRPVGKFSSAWDLKAMATMVNPTIASQWSTGGADVGTHFGGLFEWTYQMPFSKWVGVLGIILAAHAVALDPENEETQRHATSLAESSFEMIDNAKEEEVLYGGLTLGVSYNDPFLLREVPGALGHARIYVLGRLFF